jgi:pimeloyl-ACP methyl ester carboxylesterase
METLKTGRFEFLPAPWPMDTDRQTLILVHGAGMNCHAWEPQLEGLSHHVNTLALNLPGRGSSPEKANASIEQNVDYLLEFIDKIPIKMPIICGLSMGGAVVLSLLARNPGNIRAGIVINSGARLRVNTMLLKTIQRDYPRYLGSLGQFALSPKNNRPELIDALGPTLVQNPETTLRDFMACNTFNLMDDLHRITRPVLILTASDDLLTPAKYGEHLAAAIPNARFHCIADAGHLSSMERPDAVNQEIKRFINHHETTR